MFERLKYNKTIAIIVFAAVVLVSVTLSGGSALAKERTQVESKFYEGMQGDSLGIYNDVRARIDAAQNMVTVAQKSLGSEDALLLEIQDLQSKMLNEGSIGELFKLDYTLETKVKLLFAKEDTLSLNETDARLFEKQYYEFLSRGQTISHDGFNTSAQQYNLQLDNFPANLISKAYGIKPIEYFR